MANISMEEEGDNQRENGLFKISSERRNVHKLESTYCNSDNWPTSVHSLSDPIGQVVRTSSSELVTHRAGFICLVVDIVTRQQHQP